MRSLSLVDFLVGLVATGLIALITITQYQAAHEKTTQSEAQIHLSGVYIAEKAFFAQYKGYHSSLKVLGYQPKGIVRYNVGFGSDGEVAPQFISITQPDTLSTKWICGGEFGLGPDTDCKMVADTPEIEEDSTVSANDFFANAVAFELEFRGPSSESSFFSKMLVGFDSEAMMTNCMVPVESYEIWGIDSSKTISYKKIAPTQRAGSVEECKPSH